MSYRCLIADYSNSEHAGAVRTLMQCYAEDPMGGGEALDRTVLSLLIPQLQQIEGAFSVLCYHYQQPVGLINVFQGFSTFKCKPLLNVHDVVVLTEYRGQGISQKMLQQVEQVAVERGCCKVTLEVLEGNLAARRAYLRFGFVPYQLDPEMGSALFFEKPVGLELQG